MFTRANLSRLIVLLGEAVIFTLAAPTPPAGAGAAGGYGWPLRPVDRQHAIRGFFGDPRIVGHDTADATIHFGVDICGANGEAVYATIDGIASIHPLHRDVVIVTAGNMAHEYWHVTPAVSAGERVSAGRTVVGHIEAPWGHVHFSERDGGVYINPLRPGGLRPYSDRTQPTVASISFERNGLAVGRTLAGTVDIVAEAFDDAPSPVAAPWHGKPVAPAIVEWRLVGLEATTPAPWRVAVDFRSLLPTARFGSIYARWTRQNHPWGRGGRGRYRFILACRLDTHGLANGKYAVVVRVRDTAGNAAQLRRDLTVANAV